ncbi:uncharacterized protein N7500_004622 [Penicillium coprophilum]|uniref:uncharacterized protein n=1 Tax=Penicillium coprophilum TaxID=36646 RepID=UPI0023995350|nr:uncharacterized protein N7500_004622 [Penicillium coprophilum]KAJ5162792.1 hypothetical protein N7500_004622 [Penicillium coprophilum]
MEREIVPYFDGMQQGQGYNTYLQSLRVANAVTITAEKPLPPSYDITYQSEEVTEYKKLAQSLEITAGAAISGWGQEGKVDSSYLNRSEYESSTITYQVEVSSRQQGSIGNEYSFNKYTGDNLNDLYGDRFIADFIKGGKYLARVSISTSTQASKQEIKQSAEIAFKMYGTTGKVTEEVKQAVESLRKNARVKVWTHISGGGGSSDVVETFATEDPDSGSQLLAIKKEADEFYKELKDGKHRYRRFAVLWPYTNVSNFDNTFKPFDYSTASRKSWDLFDEYTQYGVFIDGAKKVPSNKFKNGKTEQLALVRKGFDVTEAIYEKVKAISKNPSEVEKPIQYDQPWVYQASIIVSPKPVFQGNFQCSPDEKKSIKTVTMIAQSRPRENGSPTDIASPTLERGAQKLFEFKAFDFGDVWGSSVVSFGKKDSSFICLDGLRASDYGYKEESVFWVFHDELKDVGDQKVIVSKLQSADVIQLSRDSAGPRRLFQFYAGKA